MHQDWDEIEDAFGVTDIRKDIDRTKKISTPEKTTTVIFGPPGTGKTTTLLNLVDEEIKKGVETERIGYVTFTRKAAFEAVDRAMEKFELERDGFPWFRTLHSLCFRSVGVQGSQVVDGGKLRQFSEWLGIEISGYVSMADEMAVFGHSEGDRAMFLENLSRVSQRPLRELYDEQHDGLSWNLVERVSEGLKKWKESQNLVDYTDMLSMFCDQEEGWCPDIDTLFVDEAQDLSRLQWSVVQRLQTPASKIYIAGDDDQTIYRWAGADFESFKKVADEADEVQVLDQSYRVPLKIAELADGVVSRIKNRRPKTWRAKEGSEGQIERHSDFSDVSLEGESVLVLCRNQKAGRAIESVLRRSGYVYELLGKKSIPMSDARAIRDWERLRRGETVSKSDALKIYDKMKSGTGVKRGFKTLPGIEDDEQVAMEDLLERGGLKREDEWFDALERLPQGDIAYIRACLMNGESLTRPRIRVSTIHGSKGGEADHVILMTDMAWRTHQEYLQNPDDEHRVWYVAVTRTKNLLSIVRRPESKLFYSL